MLRIVMSIIVTTMIHDVLWGAVLIVTGLAIRHSTFTLMPSLMTQYLMDLLQAAAVFVTKLPNKYITGHFLLFFPTRQVEWKPRINIGNRKLQTNVYCRFEVETSEQETSNNNIKKIIKTNTPLSFLTSYCSNQAR